MSEQQNSILETLTKPLVKENPYLHMLFFGPMGGGKSYTSALCSIGIYKWRREHQGEKRPIIIVNTEQSARWLVGLFETEKISVRVSPSRSPADLLKIMDAVKDGLGASLIVDSFTHHWYSFVNAYKEKHRLQFMTLADWGKVIPEWRDLFSQRLAIAPYDYFLCGRSGFEYEMEKDEETGKKAFQKVGVKAKLEGETGYEPDLCIYTERQEELVNGVPNVWWEAVVMKSRHIETSGKTFKNPHWDNFKPAFEFLLQDVKPTVEIPEGDSSKLFERDDSGIEWARQKKIVLEEIIGLMQEVAPGQSTKEKEWKQTVLFTIFSTRSWTKIETELKLEELKAGLELLKTEAEKLKKRYEKEVKTKPKEE